MSSIFNNIPDIIEYFKNATGIDFSESFLVCADKQLVEDLEGRLGIKYNRRIQFSSPFPGTSKILEMGEVSKFHTTLYVNHNWNPITVAGNQNQGSFMNLGQTMLIVMILLFGLMRLTLC